MNTYFIRLLATASATIIIAVLGWMFFQGRSFGAWGDDSPGYIYQAARISNGNPIVYYSEIVDVAWDYFDTVPETRWVMPRHHRPLDRDGWIASKYPIGAGLLMAVLGTIGGTDEAMFYIMPITATASLIFLFFLTYAVLRSYPEPIRAMTSVLAVSLLGASPLFYEYAFSQPMRDIPALSFILLSFVFLVAAKRYRKALWVFLVCAAISYGLSLNIRHTGIVVAPALILFLGSFFTGWKRGTWKPFVKMISVCGVISLFVLAPTIRNSIQISDHKISFVADQEKGELVLASNIDHVESLSLKNVFNNDGKFRPGDGSLPHYWKTISKFSVIPFFLFAIGAGIISMWRRDPWTTASLTWAGLSVLALFSLWVNPYSRYILPMYPFIALFGALGLVIGAKAWLETAASPRTKVSGSVLIVGVVFLLLTPVLQQMHEDWLTPPQVNKSLTQEDYLELRSVPDVLPGENPFLVMTGNWMYGLGEMLEGFDDIPHVRYPTEKVGLQAAQRFIEAEIFPRYDTYVWMDSSTPQKQRDLITQEWELVPIANLTFSFEPQVEIYGVNGQID